MLLLCPEAGSRSPGGHSKLRTIRASASFQIWEMLMLAAVMPEGSFPAGWLLKRTPPSKMPLAVSFHFSEVGSAGS